MWKKIRRKDASVQTLELGKSTYPIGFINNGSSDILVGNRVKI
jgi:hypothetical protein